jgi:DICT domain-containing protein
MSLGELIGGVEAHEKTLTVYNPANGVADALREALEDRNVFVVEEWCRGPENFLVLSRDEEFLTAVAVDDVLAETEQTRPGFVAESYRPILDHLDETMFTSYGHGKMMGATREIEDRAWRIGKGELHSGFQRLENFEPQADAYRRIASRDTLDVHAYAAPGGTVPDVENVQLHLWDADEIRRSWFVVYDGGGVDENKCALLAEERAEDGFYGFWTYDPSTVDYITDHLRHTYSYVESDGGVGPATT